METIVIDETEESSNWIKIVRAKRIKKEKEKDRIKRIENGEVID